MDILYSLYVFCAYVGISLDTPSMSMCDEQRSNPSGCVKNVCICKCAC